MVSSTDSVPPQPVSSPGPATFNEVLLTELRALRPSVFHNEEAARFAEDPALRASNLRALYRQIGTLDTDEPQGAPVDPQGLSALCLSGGGIRSATFNLGVIQGLARLGLLGKFDYLSSVSGGGYIASWLRAWMRREGYQNVLDTLVKSPEERHADPLAPEPKPIDHLREYSNYLTPKLGLLSADTWTGAAIVVRNLLVNWLVILPLLAVIVTLPQLCLLVVQSTDFDESLGHPLLVAALLVALGASGTIHWLRRGLQKREPPPNAVVTRCVVPLSVSALLLSTAALGFTRWWSDSHSTLSTQQTISLWLFAGVWCVVIPLLGWMVSEIRLRLMAREESATPQAYARPVYELCGILISGVVAAVLLVTIVRSWLPFFYTHPALYVILGVPILLGLYLLARTLFVAIASLSEGWKGEVKRASSDDEDREWWARLSGGVLFIATFWLALSTLCILGGYMLEQFKDQYLSAILTAVGGLSGLVASLLGKSSGTASGKESGSQTGSSSKQWVMAVAAPVCAIAAMILLARGTALLGSAVTGKPYLLYIQASLLRDPALVFSLRDSVQFLVVPVSLALLALVTGRVVNVNRFSLHGVYRNRLVRAYLGASHTDRTPNPFTGFDPRDNLRLHELWKMATPDDPIEATRPLPVINTTLNLVRSEEKLAWQQRKSESFSMTPFYCGNFHEGYRRSTEYGGPDGLSLGTAVTISGAAANPNMGYNSSPVIEFLMALFNARLGAWLGNTNERGNATYRFPGPRQAIFPLIAELFGLTHAKSKYINLSDGGHFDNLGLYEMVLRRCRYIFISDAGHDPLCTFEDLGNAIRKIRIDFGIPIAFAKKILILPRSEKETGLYCATAYICYKEADGPDVQNGQLVYIKPALTGRGEPLPYDIYSYAQAVQAFPHESTADQWFSESQFESYRALGLHLIEQISQSKSASNFATFMDLVEAYMAQREEKEVYE